MKEKLLKYKAEVQAELHAILHYWSSHAVDEKWGGFLGQITDDNKVIENAPKGSVLNSRILWAFSAAYNKTKKPEYILMATRAYEYFIKHFIDESYGGVYWTVNHKGKPLETKKQIYALSFAVYGLSEYFIASNNEDARLKAIELYVAIRQYSYDKENGGYLEALSREWNALSDLRLSNKDANAPKTLNTHLHVLEGFANLYRVWPDAGLKNSIHDLVQLFLHQMIDRKNNHLLLFFDSHFHSLSSLVSYGHDIEAAWLIQEAAAVIGDDALVAEVKTYSLKLAEATFEGLDIDGGLWYEYEPADDHLIKEKHSWPQAEAIVGFFNAFQISGDESWLNHSLKSWHFIKQHICDKACGEWHWGIQEDHNPMRGMDKVGLWKCPYHNTRACMELMTRIDLVLGLKNENNLISNKYV